jgi:hypothetical protein
MIAANTHLIASLPRLLLLLLLLLALSEVHA